MDCLWHAGVVIYFNTTDHTNHIIILFVVNKLSMNITHSIAIITMYDINTIEISAKK